MQTFKSFLLQERFLNLLPQHKDAKLGHSEHVFNMVKKAYEHLGGIHGSGFKDPDDMVKNIPMWKLHKDSEGRVRGVALYKGKNGRKRVAMASDGSPEGKKGLANIIKSDITQKRSHAEISGPSLSFHKKQIGDLKPHVLSREDAQKAMPGETLGIPHPNDPELVRHPELKDHFYTRDIGGETHTKLMVGTPGKKIK
jgi:hypothetical protein